MSKNVAPLETSLEFRNKYNITTLECWQNLLQRDNAPDNLPDDPEVYGLSHREFFNTIKISSVKRAKEYARKRGIKTLGEWRDKAQEDPDFPKDIPFSLEYYIVKGWAKVADFFPSSIRRRGSGFVSFEEAREWARKSLITTALEWSQSKTIPLNIPKSPHTKYQSNWVSWPDFLGIDRQRNSTLLSYKEAEDFARESVATTVEEWRSLEKPDGIAKQPQISYQEKGWVNWETFLGTEMITFENFRMLAQREGILNLTQWSEFRKDSLQKKMLPRIPTIYYGKDIQECFGKRWVPIEEAKAFVKKQGITSMTEWNTACNSNQIPYNIPKNLHRSYKNEGWKGAYDFFGTETQNSRGRKKGQYLADYETTRKWCAENLVSSKAEWSKRVKQGNLPSNFSKNPAVYFKRYGTWISWDHLLSKGS